MAQFSSDKLIEILLKSDKIKKDQLAKITRLQQERSAGLGKILVDEGLVSSDDLIAILSQELNIPPIDLSKYRVDPEIVKLIPRKLAERYNVIAISKIGNKLTVAMSDPTNVFAMDDLKASAGLLIDPILALEDDIKGALDRCYGGGGAEEIKKIIEAAKRVEKIEVVEEEERIDVSEVSAESKKAPIVKVVSLIINEALRKRASDIHIEPCEKDLRVRYRIDGKLYDVLSLPKKNQNAVIARIKIMSKLDITESRIPQDGRFKIKLGKKDIDFRVSVLPIAFGNKIVLRALDRSNVTVGLDRLGFLPGPLSVFKKGLEKPFGLFLITGPTGSGKSTTLYSILNNLNVPERNVITIEDPVEYELDGMTQIQIKPDIGLTFASGLKSVLRQAPDVVMVGEIRDFETADIAIKASLTGQLVFSTLHTNDACGAITRLIDMGIEPFLIASSLILTSAQRLCRVICSRCKEEIEIPKKTLEHIGGDISELLKTKHFYKGRGCAKCKNTGYFGRIGILEALLIDDEIRDMIIRKVSTDVIKKVAITKKGMKTLRDNALENFMMGVITMEEVLAITSEE